MRRRPEARSLLHTALAILSVPLSAALFMASCGSGEAPVENLCGWLADPHNCYADFGADIGTRCGTPELGGDEKKGSFLGRDKLDVCVLTQGGQVIFDPPLEIGAFPLTSAAFKIIDPLGVQCGAGSYAGSKYLFSMSVDAFPPASGEGGSSAAGGGGAGGDEGTIAGGTFSVTSPIGRETFDPTCPSGETHHFDRLEVTKCTQYEALLPRAELASNPGGIDPVRGYVRFRVYYPPTAGALEGASPTGVEYFNCAIPPAPKGCVNGVQDGEETDVDCGGAVCPTGICTDDQCARCEPKQNCTQDSDCASGDCALNEVGLLQCAEAAATGAGGGATTGSGGGGGAGGGGASAGGGGAGGG